MHKKYHWFSTYTGEVCTTLDVISSILWAWTHMHEFPDLNRFQYTFMWKFSIHGY